MIQSIQRGTIVEMLLNSLEAERYVRGALLANVVDELAGSESLAPAADLARELLVAIDSGPVADAVFHAKLGELRQYIRVLSGDVLPESSTQLARTTPRIVTGRPANAA